MSRNIFTLSCMALALLSHTAFAKSSSWFDYYEIENIPFPNTVSPQIGGLQALKDGRIALTVHSGEVIIYTPTSQTWKIFASGLHEPLGIVQESENTFVVTQLPELTRLIDEDGNGQADFYQTISDDFGMSGNYHEFLFGPAVDKDGNYYISLNVASNFAGIFEHIRGEYSPLCPDIEAMRSWHDKTTWIEGIRKTVTRMFSCVPYRGWVLKISPDGKTEPFASGFRSPNGLVFDDSNRLWVTDNQGDWIGTSPLLHVEEGDFLGHPVSLIWKENWKVAPPDINAKIAGELRKPAAALFPQGELANSPTQPAVVPGGELFGLPKGELLIGDMNQNNLVRFLVDEVNGVVQGTLIPFIAGEALGIGNNRMGFSPDGALWVGKTHLGWAGDEGLRKITWSGVSPLLVENVRHVKGGFEVRFNRALKDEPRHLVVTSHTYHYHKAYGSEKVDLKALTDISQSLDTTKQVLTIGIPKMQKNRLYTLELHDLEDLQGLPLMGDVLRYNLVELNNN